MIGIPLGYAAGQFGSDLGVTAIKFASVRGQRLVEHIAELGYDLKDYGDVNVIQPQKVAEKEENPKYLQEMIASCQNMAEDIGKILADGAIPVIIGGDHSIAMGTLSGISKYYKDRDKDLGLIWFDAHADMNTPETSPSGNIHGMPLAVLLGYGAPQLTHIADFSPKLDPALSVHIGARDIDRDERELVRKLGIRFMTMREIDERGMSACIDEAIEIASRASGGYAVTFDVDALDPGDAPGSGTLVRGGLTYREAHLAMEKIADAGGMRSLEVVEINTALDINNKTAELGVELILSALGKTIL